MDGWVGGWVRYLGGVDDWYGAVSRERREVSSTVFPRTEDEELGLVGAVDDLGGWVGGEDELLYEESGR